ncbi:MAG: class I SAM-dependent methyltransferase [Phycisphaerae bacterium]|nr:class I SAM-dependent methyltransferase [Phycisphaerae bacterium]
MTGQDYYADKLSADRLRRCYEIAPWRVRQYLDAEIRHVLDRIRATDAVLELGCGYGRVLAQLAAKARLVVGIDTSHASLQMARQRQRGASCCHLVRASAIALGLRDGVFDTVVCVQNGISAFHVNQRDLLGESIRVARVGGRVLFSSYSDAFWDARLEWFRVQSEHGLIGEIDWAATRDGVIVCKDGFTATTVSADEFVSLTAPFDVDVTIEEVDHSSLFCEMAVR